MTDRELLKLAARAAGYTWNVEIEEYRNERNILGLWITSPKLNTGWNPLNNDGDAFKLMVDLNLYGKHSIDKALAIENDNCFDYRSAMRRAIVKAAAQMGY